MSPPEANDQPIGVVTTTPLGEALVARLRARAFGEGRSIYDVAFDIVERRIRFEE